MSEFDLKLDSARVQVSKIRLVLVEAKKQPSISKMVDMISGVLDEVDSLVDDVADKYRQIDKHLSTVEDLLVDSPPSGDVSSPSSTSESTASGYDEGTDVEGFDVRVPSRILGLVRSGDLREVEISIEQSERVKCGCIVTLVREADGDQEANDWIDVQAMHVLMGSGETRKLVFVMPEERATFGSPNSVRKAEGLPLVEGGDKADTPQAQSVVESGDKA